MPKVLEEIFIIYSETETDYIPFFTRHIGDSGRDIAAVKLAIGQAYAAPPTENATLDDQSIGMSWFQCHDNSPVSKHKMRLFDKELKVRLMNYQLEKQFVIMSYYYEKYAIELIKDLKTLELQKQVVLNIFETEFGSIGEGTLACLHGWRPNSIFNNYSFVTDNQNIVDEVPRMFLELIDDGTISSPSNNIVTTIHTQQSAEYEDTYEIFKQNTHSKKIISQIVSAEYVYPIYSASSYIGSDYSSDLSAAANTIINSKIEKDIFEIKTQDRYRILAPMLEPDPLTDPDPFELGSDKIGFFDKTKFTLENLPNFSNISDDVVAKMEDQAFYKILVFYKKPIIWNLLSDSSNLDQITFTNAESEQKYNNLVRNNSPYRVTTKTAISKFSLQESDYDAVYGENFLAFNRERFIKFIEYRTPSLRPEDVYRSYFEVSSKFLDSIRTGQTERYLETSSQDTYSTRDSQYNYAQGELAAAYCVETSNSEEAARIKFEKYKAFAMKRKLEISRSLRGAALQRTLGEDVTIDLGVFGNIPFLNVLDGSSISSEDLVETSFQGLSDLVNYALQDDVYTPSPGKIILPVKLFEESVQALEKIFRSEKVKEDIKKFKISSGNQQELDLDVEANNLASIPGYIQDLAFENEDLREQCTAADITFEELMSQNSGLAFGYTMLGETTYEINFQGVNIFSIVVANKNKNISAPIFLASGQYKPLKGSMSMPRTVNYIRNINNMLPIPSSGKSPVSYVEDLIGLNSSPCSDSADEPSMGASLILRYTIHNDGSSVKFQVSMDTFNPFHNWKENYLQREEVRRTIDFYEDITKERFKKVQWGVDEVLPVIGPTCNLKEMYRDIFSTRNLAKLLCNYLTCLRIPDVNVKFPNFTFPEIPDTPVFEYPGLSDLTDQILEAAEQVLTRIICAMVKNIFDILSSPFCEEQLTRDLFGAASDSSPEIQRAAAAAFLDVGIPKSKSEIASSMVDDLVNFLTPRELCALLSGQPVNGPVYTLISNFAKNYNLESELSGREKITAFFTGIGVYIPDEICQSLNSNNIIGQSICSDTTNTLMQIRNIASRGEVSQTQVEAAVALAEKKLIDKGKAFSLLTGEISLSEMFPDKTEEKVKSAPVLMETSKVVVDCTLDMVKTSFLSSMNGYVRSLFLDVNSLVSIDDSEYEPLPTMKFLRASNNLLKIQNFSTENINFESHNTTRYLRRTLLRLVDDYEKVVYKGEFEIYKSQLDILDRSKITNPDNAQAFRDEGENIDNIADDEQVDPFEQISTALKGSLIFGTDLSEEAIDRGVTGLLGIRTEQIPTSIQRLQHQQEYQNIFNYLFPLSLEISSLDQEQSDLLDEPVLEQLTTTDSIINWNQWSNSKYLGTNFYPAGTDEYTYDPRNVSLNVSYLNTIILVIQRLQKDIEENLEAVFKVVSSENLLEVIRDFYNINLEALRESAAQAGTLNNRGQLISTDLVEEGQKITLEHPVENLMETVMTDKTVSRNYISNQTSIDDKFFLGKKETISLCEEIPDEYKDFFDQTTTNNPLRRKVFKEQIKRIAKKYYDEYKTENSPDFENVGDIEKIEEAERSQYLNVLEGVMEQMVSYMGESRMFNDIEYIQRIESKIKSRRYFHPQGDDVCIINPLSSFDQGAIKFNELVTNIFPEQYMKELTSPSNSIYTLDYSKPGPFEKAMMTTSILGYVRVVCLETLMKGAIAYSSWDIDFVSPDPLFKEYVCRLVSNNLNNEKAFQDYPALVDECFLKISGTNNRESAIRKIVEEQLSTSISILSKVLFENEEEEYIDWFLRQMFIVDAPLERDLSTSNNNWISLLTDEQINQYRKNSFTYLERYIRTSGTLNGILDTPSGLAASQRNALFDFIRFNDDYEASFIRKLYNVTDEEFMKVPIVLDVPTTDEVNSFDIGNQSNLLDIDNSDFDNDQWPDKELWSLEDFNNLMISIFNNNPGVQRYVYHLLMKYYDEQDQTSIWHGKPKTLREKMPIKAIRRKRMRFKFDKNDDFSHKMAKDFESVIPNGAGGFLERNQSGKALFDYLTSEGNSISPVEGDAAYSEDNYTSFKYSDRFYIASSDGVDIFDSSLEDSERPGDIDYRYMHGDLMKSAPPRGVGISKPSPWQPRTLGEKDVVKTVEHEYVSDFGLEKDSDIYRNVSGEVTEEEWNLFNSATRGILEQETWEEYVIDLVGDAAPIFNQIGDSHFNPQTAVNDTQQLDFGRILGHTTKFINQNHPDGRHWEHRVIYCNHVHEQGDVKDATFVPDLDNQAGDGGLSCGTDHDIDVGIPKRSRMNIGRGPGFKDASYFDDEQAPARKYTFFNNKISVRYNQANEIYELGKGSDIVLGPNDYKVPVRILLTQVKDETGKISKVFVRYLIPKTITFSLEGTDDYMGNFGIAGRVVSATDRACDGFRKFFREGYAKAMADNNSRVDRLLASDNPLNSWLNGREGPDREELTDGTDTAALNWGLTFLLGSETGESPNNFTPVFSRADGLNADAGNFSLQASMLSISKIWSQAAQYEANTNQAHFSIDEEVGKFDVLDQFFKHNAGRLLRKPTGTTKSPQQILQDFRDQGAAINPNQADDIQDVANKVSLYNKASQHSLYNYSFEEMINRQPKLTTIISLGNLIGWFQQRRVDGFYGATSRGIVSDFNISGVRGNNNHSNIWIKNEAARLTFRNEAASFDCGPSMFYGDGRVLLESYLANLKSQINQEFPDAVANEANMFPLIAYQTDIKTFREQNLYKIRKGLFEVLANPDGSSPAGFDINNQPGTMGAESELREEQTIRADRTPTLVTSKNNLHVSQQILFKIENQYMETLRTPNSPIAAPGPQAYIDMPTTLYTKELIIFDDERGSEPLEIANYFKNLNLSPLREEAVDTVFNNPQRQVEITDDTFADLTPETGGGAITLGARFGDGNDVNNFLNNLLDKIRNIENIKPYYDKILEERERYPLVLEAESRRFDSALQWASDLIEELYKVLAGLDSRSQQILEQLNVKHGLRMILAIDQRTGLQGLNEIINLGTGGGIDFEGPQNPLDLNPANPNFDESENAQSEPIPIDPSANRDTADILGTLWGDNSEASEEERIGRLIVNSRYSNSVPFRTSYFSVPIAYHERDLYIPDPCEPNNNLVGLPSLIRGRDSEMISALKQKEDFKTFYEFSIPYRRIGSLLTIHSTSMLAGYNTMPAFLNSTKSSLASVFRLMAERNNFDSNSENQFGKSFNAIEIASAMGGSFPAGGEDMDCFSLPGLNEWFTMIKEMVAEFILNFPAVVLRGIADEIDPAYREMKSHYFACETPTLNRSALGIRGGDDKTEFGLRGDEKGQKKYIPIFPSFPVDLGIGTARMLNLFNSDGGKYLGKSIDRMVSYAIGGPKQIIDASYAFQVPCLNDEDWNRTGDFRNWSRFKIGTYGRYGHPLTPITLMALSTRHLPRDREYRNQACQISSFGQRGIVPVPCNDNEE